MQSANVTNLTLKRVNLIVFIILALFPVVGMGIDLIAPSLPAISRDLHVSNTVSKNLIAIYLLGYALGSFFSGFLSDAWGRRKIVMGSFLLFMIASFLPIIFANASMLLGVRFLQGLAIAGFAVVGRAILSDVLVPERLMRVAVLVATMWGIGPVIGPVIGGYLQYYFDWQACFYFFALLSFIGLLAMIFIVPETLSQQRPLSFSEIKNNVKLIIKHRIFMGVVILMGITYSLLMVFNTLGPFLIQTALGKTSVYFGHVALCMGLLFLVGTIICRGLIKWYQAEKVLAWGIPTLLLFAFIGLFLAYVNNKNMGIIFISNLLIFLGVGVIYPACMGKGLALFRHLAGSGSSVMTVITLLITSITAFIMSFINADSAIPIAWIYLGLVVLCGITYISLVHQKKEKP